MNIHIFSTLSLKANFRETKLTLPILKKYTSCFSSAGKTPRPISDFWMYPSVPQCLKEDTASSFSNVQVSTETTSFKIHIIANMELAAFCYKQLLLQTNCKPEQVSLHVWHGAHKFNS